MRLRRNRLIECNHRRAIPVKDKEGVTTIEYGTPSSFFAVSVNDGICIYSAPDQEPDYKVVAVYPYGHLVLEVERRFEGGI